MAAKPTLTTGSVGKRLLAFAAPIIFANLIQAAYGLVDMVVVGHYIGSSGMSAVSMGAQITNVVLVVSNGLSNASNVVIGQLIGKGDEEKIPRVFGSVLTFFIIAALVVTAVLLVLTRPILQLINTPDVAFEQAVQYFIVCISGTLFVYAYNCMAAMLRGSGNSKSPMIIVIITVILNLFLDILLVAVIPLGVVGAALATIGCQFISMALMIFYIKRKTTMFDFKLKSFRIYKQFLTLILKIGLPQSIQFLFASCSFVFLSGLVNLYGVNASAAAGAAAKVQSLSTLPAHGMMAGLITLTAQNLASKQPERVMKGLRTGIMFSAATGFIVFAVCMLFPMQVFRLFTPDTAVAAAGIKYLRCMAFGFVLESIMFTIFGVVTGSGYTPVTMCCGILSAFVVRYSVSWIFTQVFHFGFHSIGISYMIGPIISSSICILFLISGKWKTARVQIK